MDERLYKEGILEPITLQEGVIGYNLKRYGTGEGYIGYILTHVICKDANEAFSKRYIEHLQDIYGFYHFDITQAGIECAIKYHEKNGYEEHIMEAYFKQLRDEIDQIERIECGIAESDLPAKEWLAIAEAEMEWERENNEELDIMHQMSEKEEEISEKIKKEEDKKRFQDLL
jgi:hypothetical protein